MSDEEIYLIEETPILSPAVLNILLKVENSPKMAREIMRNNDFVIDNLDDRWQKLAFTFYTMIVELSVEAENLIDQCGGDNGPIC